MKSDLKAYLCKQITGRVNHLLMILKCIFINLLLPCSYSALRVLCAGTRQWKYLHAGDNVQVPVRMECN